MSRIPCVKLLLVSLALFIVSFQCVPNSFAGTIQYHYDEMDRLHGVTLENGQEIIYAYDEIGNLQSRTVAGPLTESTTSLPPGMVGIPYSQTLAASGGGAPYTWSRTIGNLPAGLTLNATNGVISGTPTSAGSSSFTVQVTDSIGNPVSQNLSIVVAASLVISTTSLPSVFTGESYSQTLAANGGTTPYTWSITNNSLPAGLTLNATSGVISGTPTTAGNSAFTLQVSDINGFATSVTLPMSISQGYPITTSAGAHGTISPSGSTFVLNNGSQTFSITPATGYVVANVLVDGVSVGAVTGYTFSNVTASHTISATFAATCSHGTITYSSYGTYYWPTGSPSPCAGAVTFTVQGGGGGGADDCDTTGEAGSSGGSTTLTYGGTTILTSGGGFGGDGWGDDGYGGWNSYSGSWTTITNNNAIGSPNNGGWGSSGNCGGGGNGGAGGYFVGGYTATFSATQQVTIIVGSGGGWGEGDPGGGPGGNGSVTITW
jgi:large repetitive protein